MEISWKWLSLYVGLLLVRFCTGFPLNLEDTNAGHIQFLTGVAAILVTAGIVVLAGCLCCHRRKGFEDEKEKEFHNSPVVASTTTNVEHGHVNPIANGEFTIFTPLSPPHFNNNVFVTNAQVIRRTADDYVYGDIDVRRWFEGPDSDFPRGKLKYIRELGNGSFGKVVEGAAQDLDSDRTWTPVVVRTLDAGSSTRERILFLNDALFYLAPRHPNVLALRGRCLSAAPLLLLQESCSGGDLKSRLRAAGSEDKILQWCYQLTSALRHLHDNGFVHPDLAARNCLLTDSLTLKLGDFGLAASKYPEDYYKGGEPLIPIRWRSPESLNCTPTTIQPRTLTKEANVWSLGVVMWEICENGSQPYGFLDDDEVVSMVFGPESLRLDGPSKPQLYSDYIFRLIRMCWNNAESRPKVAQIDMMLYDLLQVHKNTQDPLLNPSDDFDRRWELFKPNTIAKTDNQNVTIDIEDEGDQNNISKPMSPSLNNLHGSLDNLSSDQPVVSSTNNHRAAYTTIELEDRFKPSLHPKTNVQFKLGPSHLSTIDKSPDSPTQNDSLTDSMIFKQPGSSESDTEEENWKRKVERGAYSEKVRLKSRSVADLMVLTHVDYSESESETPMPSIDYKRNRNFRKSNLEGSSLNFNSEGNLLNIEDTFEKELKKLQVERRDSLLFVVDSESQNNSNLSLLHQLNSPTEIKPMNQIYNIFNMTIDKFDSLGVSGSKLNDFSDGTRVFSRQDSENKCDLGYATLHNSERNSDFGSVDGEHLPEDRTVIIKSEIEERLKNCELLTNNDLGSLTRFDHAENNNEKFAVGEEGLEKHIGCEHFKKSEPENSANSFPQKQNLPDILASLDHEHCQVNVDLLESNLLQKNEDSYQSVIAKESKENTPVEDTEEKHVQDTESHKHYLDSNTADRAVSIHKDVTVHKELVPKESQIVPDLSSENVESSNSDSELNDENQASEKSEHGIMCTKWEDSELNEAASTKVMVFTENLLPEIRQSFIKGPHMLDSINYSDVPKITVESTPTREELNLFLDLERDSALGNTPDISVQNSNCNTCDLNVKIADTEIVDLPLNQENARSNEMPTCEQEYETAPYKIFTEECDVNTALDNRPNKVDDDLCEASHIQDTQLDQKPKVAYDLSESQTENVWNDEMSTLAQGDQEHEAASCEIFTKETDVNTALDNKPNQVDDDLREADYTQDTPLTMQLDQKPQLAFSISESQQEIMPILFLKQGKETENARNDEMSISVQDGQEHVAAPCEILTKEADVNAALDNKSKKVDDDLQEAGDIQDTPPKKQQGTIPDLILKQDEETENNQSDEVVTAAQDEQKHEAPSCELLTEEIDSDNLSIKVNDDLREAHHIQDIPPKMQLDQKRKITTDLSDSQQEMIPKLLLNQDNVSNGKTENSRNNEMPTSIQAEQEHEAAHCRTFTISTSLNIPLDDIPNKIGDDLREVAHIQDTVLTNQLDQKPKVASDLGESQQETMSDLLLKEDNGSGGETENVRNDEISTSVQGGQEHETSPCETVSKKTDVNAALDNKPNKVNDDRCESDHIQDTPPKTQLDNHKPKVAFDLSESQQETMPNSLTHTAVFTSTPFGKKKDVSPHTENAYSSLNLFAVQKDDSEDDVFSSNFVPLESNCLEDENNKLNYSLETWDSFLGKSFDSGRECNENLFESFSSEPQSMLFLEGDCQKECGVGGKEGDKDCQEGTFVKVPHNEGTFIKDESVQNDTSVKDGTYILEERNDGTFVIEDKKDEPEGSATRETNGEYWQAGGGWFLHPQSNSDKLSGDIQPQPSTGKGSYVGFGVDDEIMTAIRNELLEKLPHAQGASHKNVTEEEEWNQAERSEVFLKYNVYNTPLSPIPEASSFDENDDEELVITGEDTPKLNDSDSDWSDPFELEYPPALSSRTNDSPLRIPNNGHTPSQSSCCSNDTLFNFEDFASINEKENNETEQQHETVLLNDDMVETDNGEHSKHAEFVDNSDDRSIKNSDEAESETYSFSENVVQTTESHSIHDSATSVTLQQVSLEPVIETPSQDLSTDQLCLDDFLAKERNHTSAACSSSFSAKVVAPLPSPEDKPWKSLPASLLTYDSIQKPALTRDNIAVVPKNEAQTLKDGDSIEANTAPSLEFTDDVNFNNSMSPSKTKLPHQDVTNVSAKDNVTYENIFFPALGIEKSEKTQTLLETERENIQPVYENLDHHSRTSPTVVREYENVPSLNEANEEDDTMTNFYENDINNEAEYANIDNLEETKHISDDDKEPTDCIDQHDPLSRKDDHDIFGVLTDIRFSGPIDSQLMSTSFSESNDVDEQDWDSGSDTRSSSSGEFIWKEGEHEESLKALTAAPHDVLEDVKPMQGITEETTESDVSTSSSDEDGENLEFVPSAWDKFATPTKSALRSPEKSLDRSESKKSKGVWFKKQKYHCVYEYPREPESPVLNSQDLWKPQIDYAAFSDWEFDAETYLPPPTADSDINPSTFTFKPKISNSRCGLYYLTNPNEMQGDGSSTSSNTDDEFGVAPSSRPLNANVACSQFFPGASNWLENVTPDSGLDDSTPGSISDWTEFPEHFQTCRQVLPLKKLAAQVINKNKEINKGSKDVLGGLRHTRNKLKLDLPPSPSAFTSNKTFTVEPLQEPFVLREKPTFSTFGKSRFLVQHVDTPTDENLHHTKNVCFDVLPYKPINIIPVDNNECQENNIEYEPLKNNFDELPAFSSKKELFIKGEASLLDSADEDSGIESSTLERKTNNAVHNENVRIE